ncbi:TonB-dependent receptor plug domain-containing protein [Mesorhizobium sp. NPDC059025]|uniref:TonB-dependent receptor plug domain-containing protein n=1 Tax=unclassified Mesorhizobium TaxID=325217 RepID=UPI0036A06AC8
MKRLSSTTLLVLLTTAAALPVAHAQQQDGNVEKKKDDAPAAPARAGTSPVFELGEIVVYGAATGTSSDIGGQSVSRSVVTAKDIHKSNRNTLDDALAATPGVEVSNTGGSRNERLIYVRGFDRFQVPLYIDGIRVYLPADNRLDYGRFLTPDLSEIQVQKGYVSVLSGPGGMGGAINLVTRKPTKEFEGELRTGVDLGNTGDLSAFTTSGWVGTKQEKFYLQASGSFRNSDGWFLPQGFNPVPVGIGGPVEDGGRRDFSNVRDWRANFKLGYTPNETDEYVISYTKQQGEKAAPYSIYEPVRGITRTPLPAGAAYQRDWEWPRWDIDSLAFYSHTQLGDESYVKTKAYYNTFYNLLSAYDDSTFTSQKQARAFNSYYDDSAYGVSVEAGTELIPMNTLKGAVHYRRDDHTNWDHNQPGTSAFVDPKQTKLEDTWSVAVENTFHATESLDFVGGISYDKNKLVKAQKYDSASKKMSEYPHGGSSAFNWQGAAIYRYSDASEFHASISSRTRFPTLFDRFSTRFGDALPNPDLSPERAVNYELGWAGKPTETLKIGGSVFYSDVSDVIQSVSVGGGKVQSQNIGDGRYHGVEVYGEWDVLSNLTLGASYTYLKRKLSDPVRPGLKPIGTPEHSAYLYADWVPYENFTVSPNVAIYSSRWSTDRLETAFFETKGFALVNLNMNYKLNDNFEFDFGVRNIFDKNYQLAYGFPEQGRTFYLNSAMRF